MANTTWNPADISGATLSGGNLIVTVGGGAGGTRGIASATSEKYYFECTYTTLNTNSICCGIALSTASLTSPSTGAAWVSRLTGNINVNAAGSGSTLGQIPAGAVIGVAADYGSKLLWMRLAPAGDWNGSGTADPGTGVGGVSISGLVGALFPYMCGQAGDRITANFGNSAFSSVVPSGFTAGFPAPTVNVSGVREMSFTAGPTVVLGAGAAVALPAAVDVGGNGFPFTLYSHMRVPGGTTYTFDSGAVVVVPASTDSVIAIPTSARFITATAASTVQFGQSL